MSTQSFWRLRGAKGKRAKIQNFYQKQNLSLLKVPILAVGAALRGPFPNKIVVAQSPRLTGNFRADEMLAFSENPAVSISLRWGFYNTTAVSVCPQEFDELYSK